MGILHPIDQTLVGYSPGEPEFEQLVSDTLGNEGTDLDGFQAAMDIVTAAQPVTEAALSALDGGLADVSAAADAFNAIDVSGLVDDWATGVPAVNAWHSDLILKTIATLPPISTGTLPSAPPQPVTCVPCVPAPPTPTPAPGPTPLPLPLPLPTEPCPEGWTTAQDGGCAPKESQDPYVIAGLKVLLATAAMNLPA